MNRERLARTGNVKFRKRPVVIEAFQYQAHGTARDNWPTWFHEAWEKPSQAKGAAYCRNDGELRTFITTLEGTHEVRVGDWIIRGIQGELYPCKSDIFDATYEPVTDSTPEGA